FSGSGSGSSVDPFVITTVEQLQEMKDAPAADYVLGNDIDASATSGWNSGAGYDCIFTFTGDFDGRGYTIDNLTINRPASADVGMVGRLSSPGSVSNVRLSNVSISGSSRVGALVGGGGSGATITDCHVES